jgi:3-oxoacyl-[acyl-carrier-protein] synthase II
MRRVVVTGVGAISPLAAGVEASWSRLLAGRSGLPCFANSPNR